MRHEGTSRLFEMGWYIPHVAAVTELRQLAEAHSDNETVMRLL